MRKNIFDKTFNFCYGQQVYEVFKNFSHLGTKINCGKKLDNFSENLHLVLNFLLLLLKNIESLIEFFFSSLFDNLKNNGTLHKPQIEKNVSAGLVQRSFHIIGRSDLGLGLGQNFLLI